MKNRFTVIVLSSILILSLGTACQRTATGSNSVTKATSNVPFVTPVANNAIQNILAGTQTAAALSGSPAVTSTTVATAAPSTAASITEAASPAAASPTVEASATVQQATATQAAATKTSAAPTATPGISFSGLSGTYSGYPTFNISAVVKDQTVTIAGSNFPPNLDFVVLMGTYDSGAVGGTQVAKFNSDGGGSFTATFNIPSNLQGQVKIAIRIQDTNAYYYAFNWFWNNISG